MKTPAKPRYTRYTVGIPREDAVHSIHRKIKWSKKFPKTVGDYWFYGYRYGKISCGAKQEPRLLLMKVRKCQTGMIYTADGQFMYEEEVEEAHFAKFIPPELPKLK